MLMTTLMCGAMSIVMFSVYHKFPARGAWPGTLGGRFVAARVRVAAVRHREVLPPALSMIAANAALVAGIGLSMLGTENILWPGLNRLPVHIRPGHRRQ